MKFSVIAALVVAPFALASPVTHIAKRATVNDVADTGFAKASYVACPITTGGKGGATVTVSTLAALEAAVKGDAPKIVIVSGTITGSTVVKVGSNTSLLGKSGASLAGVGVRIVKAQNVIVRNLKISKVLASAGDAIGIQEAKNVWIDHNDLSSDTLHDKDFYDGLLDVTHGSTGITYSYNKLHDHWKSSLIGHSDSNGAEDTALQVTLHHNYFYNLHSRLPSFRFGQGHIYNNYYADSSDGINTRDGAQLLIENNVFSNIVKPIYSNDGGFAVAKNNDLGGGQNVAPAGTLTTVPYTYTLTDVAKVKADVTANAGATLSF